MYGAQKGLVFVAMLLAAACGGTTPGDTSTPRAPSPEESPALIASPNPSTDPSADPSVEPSLDPSVEASVAPSTEPSVEPSAEPSAGSAGVCTGSDPNREFFAAVAEAVDWTVYCPVLPAGWRVDNGQYRLAGGGWMEIAYRGPGGARFELREGAFCSDGVSACSPHDTVIGPATFGDREGELGTLGDGLVLYVDPGGVPMWQASGSGLDVDTFRSYAEALAVVAG